MYAPVQVSRRSLEEQRFHAGEETVELIRSLAGSLRGAHVLHLSISPFGTSTAELLHGLVPLLRDLGINAHWSTIGCEGEFGQTARLMYAGLSGRRAHWTPAHEESWYRFNDLAAGHLEGSYDVVMVHDPQPAGLPATLNELHRRTPTTRWVWHCHLDLRRAQPEVWQTILPALRHFDAGVFSDRAFAPSDLVDLPTTIISPAIDPTSERNVELPHFTVRQLLSRYGLDPSQPLAVQVAPFDPPFDPMGMVEIYRRAKTERPDLQLLLVHPMAEATLDGWSRFEQVARQVGADPDARVLASQSGGGQLIVNAAQRAASVVVQRSVPGGFALPLWEAQWKGRPVAVGVAGGLPLQVMDGVTGYVAPDEDRFVEALLTLVSDSAWAAHLGAAGQRWVRERHLITRLLVDELRLLLSLLDHPPLEAERMISGRV